MAKYRVVIADSHFPSYGAERDVLEPLGAVLEVHRCGTPEQVLEVARDADCLMVAWAPITEEVIRGLQQCRGIVRYGVGYEMIDVEAAARRSIPVVNVPDYCTDEVADHAMALILAMLRKLPKLLEKVRNGSWEGAPERPIHEIRGRTLGLLGMGRIGRAVVERARGFGFVVQAHDPYAGEDEFRELRVASVDFETLLATSDVLSLHTPLNDATHHIIDGRAIRKMPRGAHLVNVSRGGLVDEAALAFALLDGHLAGAALDVFEVEPPPNDLPLLTIDSLLATSHCAWYSEESFVRLQTYAAQEVARLLNGEPARHVVNGV